MIIGYARVSTDEQKLDLQIEALKACGCERIFTDLGESGYKFDRGGLSAAMRVLEPGGTLVVWRLDRLGRSLSGLVKLLEMLGDLNVHFRSLTESIDTASSGGRLMFHMMAARAEFERSLISERTRAGMEAARERGATLGRPKALSEEQILVARDAIETQGATTRELATHFGVSARTLERHVRRLTS